MYCKAKGRNYFKQLLYGISKAALPCLGIITFSILFISTATANTINVQWVHKKYFHPQQNKHYVEIYFSIPGNEVNYVTQPDKSLRASLIVSVEVFRKDERVAAENFILNSPTYKSVENGFIDLNDLVRLEVPEDSLQVVFKVTDRTNPAFFHSGVRDIVIEEKKEAFLSDVMPVSEFIVSNDEQNSFFRNGKIIMPKFYLFYPTDANRLNFYVEFYQPDAEKSYLIRYLLTDDNSVVINQYSGFKKIKAVAFDALLTGFDISTLPSGNYNLFVELRDEENKIIERKKIYFQRSNRKENTEALGYNELDVITKNFARKYDLHNIIHHTKALKAIADDFEKAAIDGLVREGNLEKLQNYFFTFWKKRDPANAEALWMSYAEKLKFVEEKFKTTTERGFETERGRVYLKYGPPVERVERPNSPIGQYEVWYYEFLNNQTAVYFVFVNQNRITEEFFMVHSNLVGEIFSRSWAERIKNGEF
jgi:GWxTD domain-containing protein